MGILRQSQLTIMAETIYFITGASRGIGLEFVHQLVKRPNTTVYAGVRTPSSLEKYYPSPPANLHIVQCDVTSDQSVATAAKLVSQTSGRVDVLINNAGIDHSNKPIRETSIAAFRSIIETNLVGVHRMTKDFLPLVQKSLVKKIINMSSDFGSVELNDRSTAGAYNTSKAALNMLTVQYKNEYAEEGIIFIPMHPGDVYPE